MSLDVDSLKILCCPVDKAEFILDRQKRFLQCKKCRHKYQINDGIPLLFPPNANHKKTKPKYL